MLLDQLGNGCIARPRLKAQQKPRVDQRGMRCGVVWGWFDALLSIASRWAWMSLLVGLVFNREGLHGAPGRSSLDQALSQRVRDSLRPIAQIQPAGHVVHDVLDRALGIEETMTYLCRVEAVGEQL